MVINVSTAGTTGLRIRRSGATLRTVGIVLAALLALTACADDGSRPARSSAPSIDKPSPAPSVDRTGARPETPDDTQTADADSTTTRATRTPKPTKTPEPTRTKTTEAVAEPPPTTTTARTTETTERTTTTRSQNVPSDSITTERKTTVDD